MQCLRSRWRPAVECVGLLILTAHHIDAQPAVLISSAVACRTCRIELVKKFTLGAPSDTVSASDFQTGVIRDSRGRYYLVPAAGLTTMAVYDSAGRFLRTIGRSGPGPGEYGFIINAEVVAGDSLFVLDANNHRLTVLSPSYSVVRSLPLLGQFTRAFPLPNGELLVNGSVNTRAAAGYPLHVIGSDGAIRRSFGSARPEVYRDRDQFNIRWVDWSTKRDVWVAHVDRYEVERWRLDGTLVRAYKRDASWFPPRDYAKRRNPDAAPPPMMLAVWEDSSGRIWTISRVASEKWKAPPRVGSSREQAVPAFEVEDRNTDAIIEVFDPSTGTLLGTQRFSEYLSGNVGAGAVYSLRATEDGDLRVDVWQVRFTKPSAQEDR